VPARIVQFSRFRVLGRKPCGVVEDRGLFLVSFMPGPRRPNPDGPGWVYPGLWSTYMTRSQVDHYYGGPRNILADAAHA